MPRNPPDSPKADPMSTSALEFRPEAVLLIVVPSTVASPPAANAAAEVRPRAITTALMIAFVITPLGEFRKENRNIWFQMKALRLLPICCYVVRERVTGSNNLRICFARLPAPANKLQLHLECVLMAG